MTFLVDGCGGEVFFLWISEFQYDPKLKTTVVFWQEGKNVMKYAMTFHHNKYHKLAFLTYFYFYNFCQIAMNDGLLHYDDLFGIGGGCDKFSNDLHGKQSAYVSKLLTTGTTMILILQEWTCE